MGLHSLLSNSDETTLTKSHDVIAYLVDTVQQLKADNIALINDIRTLSKEVDALSVSIETLRLNYGDI